MPDHIAHTIFARRVLDAAQKDMPVPVDGECAAFRAGCFGPDPLFNDPARRRRSEGFELHRMPGWVSMERMRAAVQGGMPWAAEYAAGFFCHYALDRICHPPILKMAARGEIRHVPLECAWDRAILMRTAYRLPRRFSLNRDEAFAAAQMYRRVSAGRFRADLEAFWQLRRMISAGSLSFLAAAPGKLNPEWDGLIPRPQPDEATRRGIEMLDALMEKSIITAAEHLAACMCALWENKPLDSWLNADFSGFHTQL